jgi:hypothetical protein
MVHWWLLVHSGQDKAGNKIVHMDEVDLHMQRIKFHICTNELLVLLTSCEGASQKKKFPSFGFTMNHFDWLIKKRKL